MLIRFTVKNFLSFNEEQEFSMISGKVRSKMHHIIKDRKLSLLKFAAIYGANASGKSNLVSALDFARTTIVHEIPIDIMKEYCRTNPENKNAPSSFEFEIKLANKVYAYGFDIVVSESSIHNEWLYELNQNGTQREIFVRDTQNKKVSFDKDFSKETRQNLDTYANNMISNDSVLFLTEMNRNKDDLYKKEKELTQFNEIYHWFKEQLVINYPNQPMSPAYFMEDGNLTEINTAISSLGLGVRHVRFDIGDMDELRKFVSPMLLKKILEDLKKKNLARMKQGGEVKGVMLRGDREMFLLNIDSENQAIKVQKLVFDHEKEGTSFDISEESDGTRRVLDLIELLVSAKSGSKKVYVIDEINRCLHPNLTYQLIAKYLELAKDTEIQLIVTTHEAHLMNFNLLRRDEIWFVNKNKDGNSSLSSFEEYNERFDKKISRSYLEGKYHGVPLFDEYFPMNLKEK
ncbi:MAG: ATP/GTP-binding protein [Paludibacter sp.]|nr:ATP/GTP-binding protein [Paludibacter sp.]